LFPTLLEAHPRLRLDLRFEDRFVDLLADGVDLAIRAGVAPPDSPFVVSRKLAWIDRVLCASPEFLQARRAPKTVEALASLPCVIQGTGRMQWSFETSSGPVSVSVDGPIRTNNVLAARDAAQASLGIARLPHWIVQDELRRGTLVRVLDEARMPIIEVVGMYHRVSNGSVAIQAVIDMLRHELPRRTAMHAIDRKA